MEVNISEKNVKIRKKMGYYKKNCGNSNDTACCINLSWKKENRQKKLSTIIDIFEEKYQFRQVLTEREKNYLENPSDYKDLNIEFYFMLEAVKMLLWVLSVIDIEFDDFNVFC